MGFAVVDVNMRGTGCSGGAFDFFEPLQSLDGYDIVETVARQPWVKHNKVGMMGISYGGISQLFTAQTQPPSLAAISPLSRDRPDADDALPGRRPQHGLRGRVGQAAPARGAARRREDRPAVGATSASRRATRPARPTRRCTARPPTCSRRSARNDTYRPKVADPLSPVTFVDKIKVPTFMACQFTDEQTGGHCPTLASRFTGTDKKWFTFTNGTHVDSLAPETFNRWFDFLQLYVARQAPGQNAAVYRAAAPVVYDAAMGISGVTFPPDPIQDEPTYESALAAFEKLPSVRILFDNGAGGDPGQPVPGFEHSFASFPAPGTTGRTWYFGANGALTDAKAATGHDAFTWDAAARPLTNFTGDTGAGDNGLWTATPPYEWAQHPDGTSLAYETAELAENLVVLGNGFVEARVRSTKRNVDLQATVSEVRPDGKETFVQGGWLRGNLRALDKQKSTPLSPVLSLRKRDLEPLPRKRFVKATIPLYYQGHAYRKGSRIRITISAPNGDQPIWSFKPLLKQRGGTVEIARGRSKLTLPVVPGVDVPTGLPPCPGLRGEPCRDAQPIG